MKKSLNCKETDYVFFNLGVVLKLFPNIEQIEFCKKQNFMMEECQNIMDYVMSTHIDTENNLKYIIIYHNQFVKSIPNKVANDYWRVYHGKYHTILDNGNDSRLSEINFSTILNKAIPPKICYLI